MTEGALVPSAPGDRTPSVDGKAELQTSDRGDLESSSAGGTELLRVLTEIRNNTAPSLPAPGGVAAVERGVVEEASKVPLTLLLAIPAVFTGVLPLLSDYVSEVVSAYRVAGIATTFFVVFFALPILLLVFRAYNLGYASLFLYSLVFATTAYGVQSVSSEPWRSLVIYVFALAFAAAPHLFVSRMAAHSLRTARALRAERREIWNAARERMKDPQAEPPPVIRFRGIERRSLARRPSYTPGILSVVLALGMVMLFNAPAREDEFGWLPVEALWSPGEVGTERYRSSFALIPVVDDAHSRNGDVQKLRSRDLDALAYFPEAPGDWNSALEDRRELVRISHSALPGVVQLRAEAMDSFHGAWNDSSTRWSGAWKKVDDGRKATLAKAPVGGARDTIAERVAARVDSVRNALRMSVARNLSAGNPLAGSAALGKVDSLEQLLAVLHGTRSDRQSALLGVDDQLITQQAIIFTELNGFVQRQLTRAVNNARIVGLWMFAITLLVLAVTLAVGSLRSVQAYRGEPGTARRRLTARLIWFQVREGRRRGTYVLGCALLAIFCTPLLQRVKPEKLDVARPFSPFTLPTWYFPAFAEQSVRAGMRGSVTDVRGFRQGAGTLQVVRDSTLARDSVIVRDTVNSAALGSAVRQAINEALADPENPVVSRVGAQISNSTKTVTDSLGSRVDSLERHIYRRVP